MMSWRYAKLGILWWATLIAGNSAGRLPADDRDVKTGPSRAAPAEKSASPKGRRFAAPRVKSPQASAAHKPSEIRLADVPDILAADDDDLAIWAEGPGNRLISLEASPLPASPDDEDEELDFDPRPSDFRSVLPGDDQPYWILPADDEPQGWVGGEFQRPTDLSGSDFFPVPDRYRMGYPRWDRYVKSGPLNPYALNVLKGDYPLRVGGNTFLELTAVSDSFIQARRKTIKVANPALTKLQTDTQQRQRLFLTLDYFEDDNTFTPSPWFFRLTQVAEYRDQSDAVGYHDDYSFLEAFFDYRIAFLTDYGDQLNWRIGRQAFNSDFRGFLFSDVNNMSRVFGTWNENKWQYNFIAVSAVQDDPVTQLPSFHDNRHLTMIGGNVFRRDVPWLGFNLMGAGFYVNDNGTGNAGFQAQHAVDVAFLEAAAEGIIGPFGISAAFIQALGRDQANPFAQRAVDINAQFAALEVTLPTDWYTPRFSIMYASGDKNPRDGTGRGFDAVFDNPNFAGNNFAYFGREQLQGRGNQIVNFNSFLPNLRNKFFDAMNFVNPGIVALTAGFDTTVTTTLNAFVNYNYYRFVEPAAVENAIAVAGGGAISINNEIGHDLTIGLNYRPLIVNNITCNFGTTGFFQGRGFQDISGNNAVLFSHFANLVLIY